MTVLVFAHTVLYYIFNHIAHGITLRQMRYTAPGAAASRNHQEPPRAGPGQLSRQEVRCFQQLFNSEIQGVGKVSPEIEFL